MRGRKPKPTSIKILHGSQNCRINKDEPKPELTIPDCPDGLSEIGQQEWKRISTQLYELKMISNMDTAILLGYCHSFEQFIQSAESLKKTGYLIKAPSGYPIVNPLLSINNEAKRQMLKYAQELGLSVVQRTRIKIDPDKKVIDTDPLEKFLKGG